MRKALAAVAILIVTLVPVSGRTAVDTRVVTARGQAKSQWSQAIHGSAFGQSYDLYGTFKVNGVTYTGHVTGYWYFDGQGGGSSVFSGSDNGVISGSCYPSGGLEGLADPDSLICYFSINYTRTAQFTLQFVWTSTTSSAYLTTDYTGVFVGV